MSHSFFIQPTDLCNTFHNYFFLIEIGPGSSIAGRMRTIRKYLIIISLPLALGKHFKSFSTKSFIKQFEEGRNFIILTNKLSEFPSWNIIFPQEIKTEPEMVSAVSGEWTKATIERNYWLIPCGPLYTFYVLTTIIYQMSKIFSFIRSILLIRIINYLCHI